MLTPITLDLAHAVIRDRLQQAAREALADQLRHSPSAASASRPGLAVARATARATGWPAACAAWPHAWTRTRPSLTPRWSF